MHMTIDIDTYRNQLLEDIRTEDNLEVLERVRQAYTRAIKSIRRDNVAPPFPPYTLEELESRVEESEAEFTAGKGIPSEEAHCRMQRFIADL